MEKIILNNIIKKNNKITYDFEYSENIGKYFSDKEFIIEYNDNIETVPDAILAIPFVCSTLPIIWLSNSELVLSELDKSFYESIFLFKEGYQNMYPETEFVGKFKVEKIIECSYQKNDKCAMFFSGGLDSVQTFVSHLKEKPDLISIWGSDIKFNNLEGWERVHKNIANTAERFQLKDIVIRSTFREFDKEKILDEQFSEQLQDGWWHGVKHGIALLGHVAPYAYIHQLSKMYIASSNCPSDGKVRCASNPAIDNYVRFANCQVIHDGYEFSRQDKIHNVVNFVHATKQKMQLHVCWQSQEGSNCCQCEKCYRTMAGLWAEGEDPKQYGFIMADENLASMEYYIKVRESNRGLIKRYGPYIQNTAKK